MSLEHIIEPLRHLAVPVGDIAFDPVNTRHHDDANLDAITGSLRRFGQRKPIVVNKTTGIVEAGNGTLEAAKKRLGWTHLAVVYVEDDPVTATAFSIADNRTAELATWNEDELAKLLASMPSTNDPELDAMFDALRAEMDDGKPAPGGGGDDFDPTPSLGPTRSQKGDLWVAKGSGSTHRLLCGSCTDPESLARLFAGATAAMAFQDPPWNVAIGKDSNPRHRQREGLQNDDLPPEEFRAFLAAFATVAKPFVRGDFYCVLGASEWPTLDSVLRECGYHWSATIIWVKDIFVLGRSKYHRRYEPIWYGWPDDCPSSFGERRDLDDVWEIPRPKVSTEHPTMKPVELVQRAIQNSSKPGDLVYDAFLGSGTTLVAAHREGRNGAGCEIDPVHFDTCLRRLEAEGLSVEKVG